MDVESGTVMLEHAVSCDRSGSIFLARYLYQQSLQTLFSSVKEGEHKVKNPEQLKCLEKYAIRIGKISEHIEGLIEKSEPGGYIEYRSGQTNCGYEVTFGPYFTNNVLEMIIEEPQMSSPHHFKNLVTLIELMLLKSPHLNYIEVVTCLGNDKDPDQNKHFESLKRNLKLQSCLLGYRFQPDLRDTRIILSNGRIFRITQHGLHYLNEPEPGQHIGGVSQRFLKSKETVINVFCTVNSFSLSSCNKEAANARTQRKKC